MEASKIQEASVRKANVKFAEDLRSLQKEATRAEKLEEAVALRDAAKYIDDSQVKPKFAFPLMFEREGGVGNNVTLAERGYRWSDWKPNLIGRYETTTTGGINCFHPFSNDPKTSGKMWAQLVISFDRKSAIWWAPGEPIVALKAKGH